MESSTREMLCDLEEDEDMESFLKTIKLHERYIDDFCEDDEEILSDEDDSRDFVCRPKDRFTNRSIFNSEATSDTLSMLDTVRSSCQSVAHNFSRSLLNLKGEESCLKDCDSDFLRDSYSCRPPFGDPLSEDDILQSALSLLDHEQCKKFREVGLFDGFVVKGNISNEAEKFLDDDGTNFTERLLDLTPLQKLKSPKINGHKPCDLLTLVLESEPVKEPVIPTPLKSESTENISQNLKVKQEQNICEENQKCCTSDNATVSNIPNSVVGKNSPDVSSGSNQDQKKKMRCKKGNSHSAPSSKTKDKKSKKLQKKELNLAEDFKAEEINFSDEGKIDDVKKDDSSHSSECSNMLRPPMLISQVPPSDVDFAEDEEIGEEFTVVLNKKKSRTRKSAHNPVGNFSGDFQKARSDEHLRFATGPVSRLTSRPTSKPSKDNGACLSKQSSCFVSESSCFVADTPARSQNRDNQGLSEHPSMTSTSSSWVKTVGSDSYVSVLSQNLPKCSVDLSKDVSSFPAKGDVDVEECKLSFGSEVEIEGLLLPPQSEADTGFSSASSLSTDETHGETATHGSIEVDLSELPSSTFLSDKTGVYQDRDSTNIEPQTSSNKCHDPELISPADSNQLQVAQHRKGAIFFFDTRNPQTNRPADPLDIVFGFDSDDECAGCGLIPPDLLQMHGNTLDLGVVTFFASSDSRTDPRYTCNPLQVPSPDALNITFEGNNEVNTPSQVSDQEKSSTCDGQNDASESVDPGSGRNDQFRSVAAEYSCSGDTDTDTTSIAKSYSKFDLRMAQKFLRRAFNSILGQEIECTS